MTADEAIREAISNNLDLAAARYNISVADARQITAKLSPNPVADRERRSPGSTRYRV